MKPNQKENFQQLFEYAPISLWEEDYSAIRQSFAQLRASGVQSLRAYMDEHPRYVDECMAGIRVLRVNRQTLTMFKAATQDEFLANLDKVLRDGMRHHMQSELLALWQGDLEWSGDGINYTLAGEPLDILLHWRILPGSEENWQRVLVTIEDISARKKAERRLDSLFQASPISLWVEDYSAVKAFFDELREAGVEDLDPYLRQNPAAVGECMRRIRVLSVNQKTLELFDASSQQELIDNLDQVFRDEMSIHFAKELVDLWNGRLEYEREGINYTLAGEELYINLNFRVMPGHEEDFSWVQVAIQDITARKKAEQYLRYLGTHDVMTGLYNRAYFQEVLTALEKKRVEPISIIVADLNDLKMVNDSLGHLAGDDLLRRAAEVLKACFDEAFPIARLGGDEFCVLLPGQDLAKAQEAILRLRSLMRLNNNYYRQPELSMALGAAVSQPGLSLEKVFSLADKAMYTDKISYHHQST